MSDLPESLPSGDAPYRRIPLGPCHVDVTARDDGSLLVCSGEAAMPYPAKLTDKLSEGAAIHPHRLFLAVRKPDGDWQRMTYREAMDRVLRIAQSLLERGLSEERPIAILSGSSIEHALLALAAMHVGIPHCPVTPAYSLVSTDFAKLKHVLALLTPGLVFVDDGAAFDKAIVEVLPADVEVLTSTSPLVSRTSTPFEALQSRPASAQVSRASAAVMPDSTAKILFTSGSTGMPKGVINTQRMLSCNQAMFAQAFPVIFSQPPIIVSWLPWHHTSGANQMMGLTIFCGGSLYVDDGKPIPGEIGKTVANLREVAPTIYFSVPRGFAELIPYLRAQPELRQNFFSKLSLLYYSGAALGDSLVADLDELAVRTVGERIPMMCGYGATETAPLALATNWICSETGLAGLPVPGCELKLVPVAEKYEACLRGPHVTPGYWRQPELTRKLFDSDGFARMGDALSFVEPGNIARGLAFDGRLAEDFKLSTGTWVNVGTLRSKMILEAKGVFLDVVLAGENRDEIAALLLLDRAAAYALCDMNPQTTEWLELLAHPGLRAAVQTVLDTLARRSTGSSTRIARAIVLEEAPSAAAGELTDKGSINQRALLAHRSTLVDRLYAASPVPAVLVAQSTVK
ncbi:feruloyl-CoA synthase [Variovorax sp. PBL-E5]|uniref:feruloyl-CoA synthase n=1 Tax=Variovorax sp. PBL-E5 TaxID=434014 RepID=UPI0013193159|nr:feruloyl-CoA synthase [Variovorax sp. PBL-E5]VTU45180.1 Long-chain-fatty-acid--CoA ligase [Variovorax sp. PBL-E5]